MHPNSDTGVAGAIRSLSSLTGIFMNTEGIWDIAPLKFCVQIWKNRLKSTTCDQSDNSFEINNLRHYSRKSILSWLGTLFHWKVVWNQPVEGWIVWLRKSRLKSTSCMTFSKTEISFRINNLRSRKVVWNQSVASLPSNWLPSVRYSFCLFYRLKSITCMKVVKVSLSSWFITVFWCMRLVVPDQ